MVSISSRVRRFVSGTKNQTKAAPIKVRTPKKMNVPLKEDLVLK